MKATLLAMTRFLALSGLSFGMNLGLTVLFHEVLNLSQEASLATAMVLVSVMNFIGCRYFVFETSDAGLAKQLVMFYASWLPFRGLEYLLFLVLHTWLNMNYVAAVVLVQLIAFMSKFLYFRQTVFRSGQPAVAPADVVP